MEACGGVGGEGPGESLEHMNEGGGQGEAKMSGNRTRSWEVAGK